MAIVNMLQFDLRTILLLPVLLASAALLRVLYTVVYRLYFHPLSKIPGPRLAAVSWFYEIYFNVWKPGMYVWEVRRLHEIYGPIIRVNPDEVHVSDLSFIDEIYSATRPRNKDERHVQTQNLSQSIGDTCDHRIHKRRRGALVPFFSKPAVSKIELLITERLERLSGKFDSFHSTQDVVNLSDIYFGLAQDLVSHYCFGVDDDLVSSSDRAAAGRANITALMEASHQNVYLADSLFARLPKLIKDTSRPASKEFGEFAMKVHTKISSVLSAPKDKPSFPTVFHEIRDSTILPPEDKTADRLFNEAMLIVMAGSESTHKSLHLIHYYLLSQPEIMTSLRAELRANNITSSTPWNTLERLPYLSAVIAEANRLNFGLTIRNSRTAPYEDLVYKSYTIPRGTPMSTYSLLVNTNEELYPDPWAFRPERWLDGRAAERHMYMNSFGSPRGSRRCIGINLAHMILYRATVVMARYEMRLFETDVGDVEFRHDFLTAQPKRGSKGVRAVVEKEVGW